MPSFNKRQFFKDQVNFYNSLTYFTLTRISDKSVVVHNDVAKELKKFI